ncbi:MAG: ABC transporter permease [Flavobacteriaceae bacterium]|nr:ABC transporter permease [Flavobacteriaceae bacterium]
MITKSTFRKTAADLLMLQQGAYRDAIVLPIIAIATALLIGALIMTATGVDIDTIGRSFSALGYGAFGSINAISETFTAAIPLILAGLGIGVGFRAGLFNIGAEGQIIIGGLLAVIFSFTFSDLPTIVLVTFTLIVGSLAGAAYAGIAGVLRAVTGAHEVILTIMLNLISYRILDYALRQPFIQKDGRSDPISKSVPGNGQLPKLLDWIDPNLRLHAGVFLMLGAVILLWWLIKKSKMGFAIRTNGENSHAALYAGMNPKMVIIGSMAIAGGLAGLAGAVQISGVLERASPGFSAGIGFDAIAVALLGRSHPIGILFAGILFGGLEAGGRQMQIDAGVSIDLISIIQALVVVFIAAPLIIRTITPWAFSKNKRTS